MGIWRQACSWVTDAGAEALSLLRVCVAAALWNAMEPALLLSQNALQGGFCIRYGRESSTWDTREYR